MDLYIYIIIETSVFLQAVKRKIFISILALKTPVSPHSPHDGQALEYMKVNINNENTSFSS